MKLNLLLSTCLHLLVIGCFTFFLSGSGGSNANGKKGQGKHAAEGNNKSNRSPSGEIIPPEVRKREFVEIVPIESLGKKKTVLKPQKLHTKAKCPDFFGGIGINHSSPENVITMVVQGYPAYYAGLVAGDQIISDLEAIRGEPGTQVTVTARKINGNIVSYTMLRDKICVEKIKFKG